MIEHIKLEEMSGVGSPSYSIIVHHHQRNPQIYYDQILHFFANFQCQMV